MVIDDASKVSSCQTFESFLTFRVATATTNVIMAQSVHLASNEVTDQLPFPRGSPRLLEIAINNSVQMCPKIAI